MSTDNWRLPGRGPAILLVLVLAGLAGCSDLTSLLRDELAMESETIDRITNVTDEASAKDYIKAFEKPARDRMEKIRDRKMEAVEGLEKGAKAVWRIYDGMVNKALAVDVEGAINGMNEMAKSGPEKLMDDLKKEFEKPITDKGDTPDPKKWEKNIEEFPSSTVLYRYLREKLALKVAREREVARLQKYLQDHENSPSMTQVLSAVKK